MRMIMTSNTKLNYVKVVGRIITSWMMVMLGLIVAVRTFLFRYFWQKSLFDSRANNSHGIGFFAVSCDIFPSCDFTFFALVKFQIYQAATLFSSWRLLPFNYPYAFTVFTGRHKTAFSVAAYVKFRNWFNCLAFGTAFCFNWFRHFRFLNKRSCLEPVASTNLRSARSIVNSSECKSRVF